MFNLAEVLMNHGLRLMVAFVCLIFSNLTLAIPVNINHALANGIARVKGIGVVTIKKNKELILII
jgi:hypothetical protein